MKFAIPIVAFIIGVVIGKSMRSDVIQSQAIIEMHEETIRDLQLEIISLHQTNTKEDVETVITEKPDGSKVTRRIRNTVKSSVKTVNTVKKEKTDNSVKSKEETSKIEKNFLKNGVGVLAGYNLSGEFQKQIYLRSSTKCWIVDCQLRVSHDFSNKETKALAGLELKF